MKTRTDIIQQIARSPKNQHTQQLFNKLYKQDLNQYGHKLTAEEIYDNLVNEIEKAKLNKGPTR